MKYIIFIFVQLLFTFVRGDNARFDNYRVYTFTAVNQDQIKLLRHLENSDDGYDFWTSIALGRNIDVMVAPHKVADFHDLTHYLNISYEVKIENVQNLIENERSEIRPKAFGWTDYNTIDEINAWMDSLLIAYPKILTNHVIGESYQGRPIRVMKLSHKENNPGIFIEANIHAREWIASATATWLLNELLTSTDPAVLEIAQNIDWYILPVLNVDGYVYSHKTNRMWRKTRQPHAFICYGTDGNRNFDFHWMTQGASNNPCSDNFAGPKPFSEPETKALDDFLKSIASTVKVYLAFHSYGQYIIFPYSHTFDLSWNHENLMAVGKKAGEAFGKRYGSDYIVGTSADVMYFSPGASDDYAFEIHNISLAYTFELRDRRFGKYGFLLPADQIIPNSQEALDGLLALVAEARRLNQL